MKIFNQQTEQKKIQKISDESVKLSRIEFVHNFLKTNLSEFVIKRFWFVSSNDPTTLEKLNKIYDMSCVSNSQKEDSVFRNLLNLWYKMALINNQTDLDLKAKLVNLACHLNLRVKELKTAENYFQCYELGVTIGLLKQIFLDKKSVNPSSV